MKAKSENIFSAISIIIACFALFYSWKANQISKMNSNPYFKIEYLTIYGYDNFQKFWNSSSTFLLKDDIGIEKNLWQIESENVKITNYQPQFFSLINKTALQQNISIDTITNKIEFEVIHIKNVSNIIAKNVTLEVTESHSHEVVNVFSMDVAESNESIVLLSKIYYINSLDTIIIGPQASLERIKYDGLETDLTRENRERFKQNHIVRSVSGNSLISQCPFVYTQESGKWVLEDAILKGIDNKKLETTTTIILQNFNGIIKILEIEEETTYINQLYIEIINQNNDTTRILPKLKSIQSDDNNYLVLEQTESKEIEFNIVDQIDNESQVILYSKGYYKPYSTPI